MKVTYLAKCAVQITPNFRALLILGPCLRGAPRGIKRFIPSNVPKLTLQLMQNMFANSVVDVNNVAVNVQQCGLCLVKHI